MKQNTIIVKIEAQKIGPDICGVDLEIPIEKLELLKPQEFFEEYFAPALAVLSMQAMRLK